MSETHKKMKITAEEFDEYIRLFFEICCPDICFRMADDPTFDKKIREIISAEKLSPAKSFNRALLFPVEGSGYSITLPNFRVMASAMVDFSRERNTITIDEIKVVH